MNEAVRIEYLKMRRRKQDRKELLQSIARMDKMIASYKRFRKQL